MKIIDLNLLLKGARVARPEGASDQAVAQLGLDFDAAQIWLPADVRTIDAERLQAGMSARARSSWPGLELVDECQSTNLSLMALGQQAVGHALTTEYQWGGRGRRGREWLSPVARNIALSVAWEHPGPLADLSGLSLAVGVACVDALRTLGLDQAALKWPNDLVVASAPDEAFGYAKLGGILIELQSFPGQSVSVIGIGLNVAGAALLRPQVEQHVTDVSELSSELDRTSVLVGLLNALADYLQQFAESGFEPLVPIWNELHAFQGRSVVVGDPSDLENGQHGKVVGVTASGQLRLATASGECEVSAGEVSLRPGSVQ